MAFLNPTYDCLHLSGGRLSGAMEPVIDTRRQEQARELRGLLCAAHLLLHPLVIIDGACCRDELIGQAVIDDDLAAPITETS